MSLLRILITIAAVFTLGWWLFADTYERRAGDHGATPLRFAHFGSYEDYQFWKSVIEEYQRECPTFEGPSGKCLPIRQEYIVGNQGQYNTKMRQQMISGMPPDIALMQLAPFREFGERFAELSNVASKVGGALNHDALGAFQVNGVQRGIPVSGGNLLIYLNRGCLQKAATFRGKPFPMTDSEWTRDQFMALAEFLTCDFDGDGKIDQFGFWLPQWVYYLPFVWSAGAEFVDSQGTWRFTGPEMEDALRFYRDLSVTRRVCPRDAEVPQLYQDTAFVTGRVAMCVNGPWFQPFLDRIGQADAYEVLPIPRAAGGRWTRMTWDGLVLSPSAKGERCAAAERFIAWVCGKRVQDRLASLGKALPARLDSMPVYARIGDHRRTPFIKALEYSRVQPFVPRFPELDRMMNTELRRWMDPTTPVDAGAFVRQLQLRWERSQLQD